MYISLFLRGKLRGRPVTAATDCQAPSRRIFVSDQKPNLRFLIDTGSDVSCYPKRLLRDCHTSTDFKLSAANGSTIKTYGTCSMTLDLGLHRSFAWQFTVADVSVPIIGSDFLSYYHLLPDCRLLRLHDAKTGLITGGQLSVTTQCSVKSVVTTSSLSKILHEFPEITRPPGLPREVKHQIVHHIHTTPGPPVFCRPRRLASVKLKLPGLPVSAGG
ncbi:uncharacterized protein LOC128984206 [Macrosteles quadrilineatus]|uniref:uncharacterized protein LOC128984206 n=1 Tax=Macrosteles quadrilineatus TaxID=74068 RepID=UPI0023E3246F|nr:uncharacterized protein LOC128984206 [Macrosteles quadrilineatus]